VGAELGRAPRDQEARPALLVVDQGQRHGRGAQPLLAVGPALESREIRAHARAQGVVVTKEAGEHPASIPKPAR